jgi:hypothetical protein
MSSSNQRDLGAEWGMKDKAAGGAEQRQKRKKNAGIPCAACHCHATNQQGSPIRREKLVQVQDRSERFKLIRNKMNCIND